jgi:hypothetical protein
MKHKDVIGTIGMHMATNIKQPMNKNIWKKAMIILTSERRTVHEEENCYWT